MVLNTGYALDCEGNDMVVEDDVSINILQRLEEEAIDPDSLEDDQGVCLYLEYTEDQELDVGIELYEPDNSTWIDRLRNTLLFDFYEDCILDLIKMLTGELQETDVEARCGITRCGKEEIRPVQRRALTLTNLLFQFSQGESATVLNISHCEHTLLQDLYVRLRNHLRSKTFCAQFQNVDFPIIPSQKTNAAALPGSRPSPWTTSACIPTANWPLAGDAAVTGYLSSSC